MKILTLTHEYPPVGGGGGRVAMDIARELVRRGHEVKIITAHFDNLPPEQNDQGVTVLRVKSLRKEAFRASMGAMSGYVIASFWRGLKVIRQWKPDVIHVHFAVPAGAAAWALSVVTGVPYVLTGHLGDVPGTTPQKTDRWFRWIKPFTPPIWKRASQVAVVSAWVKEMAEKNYPVPMQVIPNGVEYEAMDPGEIRLHTPPIINFAGRFVPQKNLFCLIEVLSRLKDLSWTAVLMGDGPLRPAVEAALKKQGIAQRVTLTGWVTPDEVQEWNRKSDILFMPSLSEGLPVVGVQALAMGLAMVMSDAGGNVDLVNPGVNGFVFEPNDVDAYERVLRELLTDPEKLLRFRKASREFARQFDQKMITTQYEIIFSAAIS